MNWQPVILAVIVIVAAYFLWPRKEVWSGVIYPNAPDLMIFERIGDFDSLEECRVTVLDRIQLLEDPNAADYECGLNCEPYKNDPELVVCKETAR